MNTDEIDDLRQLLAAHRQTLAILLKQVATHGEAHAAPAQLNSIVEARAAITRLKQVLRAEGVVIADAPNDDVPVPQVASAAPERSINQTIEGGDHPIQAVDSTVSVTNQYGDTIAGDKVAGDKVLGDKHVQSISGQAQVDVAVAGDNHGSIVVNNTGSGMNDQQRRLLEQLLEAPNREAERFERHYRSAVQSELERIEIFGVPVIDDKTKRQEVSIAYVSLDVEVERSNAERDDRKGEFPHIGDDTMRERATIAMPVNQLLATTQRLVLSAEAGSGKTTLMQWIALRAAGRDFPDELAQWNDMVPFFIRLRALKDGRGFPMLADLTDLIGEGAAGRPPKNWARDLFEAGRALVLVDGVDELPQARRELMLRALKELVRTHPHSRYLITSRPLRVKEQAWAEWESWLDRAEFKRVRLMDMTLPTIDLFVDHWHAALLQACPGERAEIQRLPAMLKTLFRQRLALQNLATNPLICAMICALHYDRRNNLPSKRVALYKACIETLILRDSGRSIDLAGEFVRIDPEQQQRLIQELAYWLSRSGELYLNREDADQRFAYELEQMEVPKDTSGHDVSELFIQRVRLLQEPLAGRVEFVHRTFQEFLAAQMAVQSGEIDELLRHADDDRWRETIILAAGMTIARQSDRLLRGLLTAPAAPTAPGGLRGLFRRAQSAPEPQTDAERRRTRRLTLAVACLETCVQRSPAMAEEVLRQAAPLFPPYNEGEAKLLAAAGPAAIPLLLPHEEDKEYEAAACVMALAQIGGDAALEALRSYVDDGRLQVIRALCNAWDRFDRRSYAQAILMHMPRLHFSKLDSWDEFDLLSDTCELSIDATSLDSIAPLRQLTKLIHLAIGTSRLLHRGTSRIPISELWPLQELVTLTSLYLSNTQVSDLTPLRALTALTTLRLNNTSAQDLTPLRALTGLTELLIDDTQVQDLTPLSGLVGLTRLDIDRTPVHDLTPLRALTGLTTLYFNNTQVSDLTPLRALTGLTSLSLSNTQVSDLTPLSALTSLTTLYFNNTQVSDLTPLRALTGLTELYLSNTQVSDLTPLSALTCLTSLSLNNTQVSDLTPLRALTGLTELYLSGTQVSDLTPLRQLVHLEYLNISGLKIRSMKPVQGLRDLTIVK